MLVDAGDSVVTESVDTSVAVKPSVETDAIV